MGWREVGEPSGRPILECYATSERESCLLTVPEKRLLTVRGNYLLTAREGTTRLVAEYPPNRLGSDPRTGCRVHRKESSNAGEGRIHPGRAGIFEGWDNPPTPSFQLERGNSPVRDRVSSDPTK
jgi:hypothetical protein